VESSTRWNGSGLDDSGTYSLSRFQRKTQGSLVSLVFKFGRASTMTLDKRIRILTVDDHPVLREGIAAILANEPDMALVAEADNGREAVARFREHRPDITLMDLQMPVMSGSDAILAIRKEFPAARIIVLTTYSGDVQAARAFKAGAYGYLLKSTLRKDLVETIRAVHGGKKKIPAEIAVELAEHHTDDALTEREIEVLRQVASGNANKIIADNLEISEETVKAHMRKILSKLGANDRTHAVAIALKRGIFEI
jgi:DNA-binding NarL/FixJ family response regulator